MMDLVSGIVFNVQRYSLHDGPGIRTTFFLKGCPLRCAWCHNPESQSPELEPTFSSERCIACMACLKACEFGAISPETLRTNLDECERCVACTDACPTGAREMAGRPMSVAEVVAAAHADQPFHDESGGGVTFSGGEPLMQRAFLLACLEALRERGVSTAVDTCVFTAAKGVEQVAKATDLMLIDLKHTDSATHRKFTGVPVEPILANIERVARLGRPFWIRIPLVPGFNDDPAGWPEFGRFLAGLPSRPPVQILPYHRMARHKYERLGRPDPMPDVEPPSDELCQGFVDALRGFGLDAKVRG